MDADLLGDARCHVEEVVVEARRGPTGDAHVDPSEARTSWPAQTNRGGAAGPS